MAINRIRGRRLQTIRALILRTEPRCRMCLAQGKTTPATQVDHIIAITNGGADEPNNMQGLCGPCHRAKTAVDMGYRVPTAADASGYPVGNHPWNAKPIGGRAVSILGESLPKTGRVQQFS